jgi:hypothetical protein
MPTQKKCSKHYPSWLLFSNALRVISKVISRYGLCIALLVCAMFKFFSIAPGIEGESPQTRELSETGSHSGRGLVPKSPFVRPLHRPSNYQQCYGRILASECVDAKTEMLTLHANIPCTRYLKRR